MINFKTRKNTKISWKLSYIRRWINWGNTFYSLCNRLLLLLSELDIRWSTRSIPKNISYSRSIYINTWRTW